MISTFSPRAFLLGMFTLVALLGPPHAMSLSASATQPGFFGDSADSDTAAAATDERLVRGKVVAVDNQYLTVEHGLLSKSNYYIPLTAVNACNAGRVYLNVAKDAVSDSSWDVPPAMMTDAGDLTVPRSE